MLSIVCERPSLFTWEILFSLILFALPVQSIFDAEASQLKLDSVYVGRLSAAWIDTDHIEGCGERLLGALDNSTLTFGPTHDPLDTNPYFISLISSENENLTVSIQSSISVQQLVKAWWEVGAKLENNGTDYSISGTLRDDTDLDKNTFSGKFAKSDPGWCGVEEQSFVWKHKVDTSTFSGTVSATEAIFSMDGSVLDENTNRLISYVIQFQGSWDPKSAKLSLDQPTPTWPTPGNPNATTEQPQSSAILVDSGPTPIVSPDGSDSAFDSFSKDLSKKIGIGGIAGITAGAVFVTGFIIMAIFCILHRRKRQQEKKVYPEIAYIYTPSPDPSLDSSVGYSRIISHYRSGHGSDFEVRQVLVNNDRSLPVTDQHQWRSF